MSQDEQDEPKFVFTDEDGNPYPESQPSPVFEKFQALSEAQSLLALYGIQYQSLDKQVLELKELARTADPESMEWWESKRA
jgi:hypothetical protein